MRTEKSVYLWLIGTAAFFALALGGIYLFDINKSLFLYLNNNLYVLGAWFWSNMTLMGDALVVSVIALVLIKRHPKLFWALVIAALITTLFVHTLKPNLAIRRPAGVLDPEMINIIGRKLKSKAFPSGHTASIFVLCGILLAALKKTWAKIGVLIFAFSVGLSRIAVSAHWPADVAGGAFLGLISVAVGLYLADRSPWGYRRVAQHIYYPMFLIAALVLLVNYDSYYPLAIWLQRLVAVACLGIGLFDYYKFLKPNK